MEVRVTQNRVDRCLDTIEAICRSPHLQRYLIGFTHLPASEKGDMYRRIRFDHLVLLADKMPRAAALELEQRLQRAIFTNPGSTLFRKYHDDKRRKGVLYPSWGGSPRDASAMACSVYMVWWER
jgi:hypothetical protein